MCLTSWEQEVLNMCQKGVNTLLAEVADDRGGGSLYKTYSDGATLKERHSIAIFKTKENTTFGRET